MRCPLNARPNSFCCLLYLDKRGRLKARIHGRPRSDRKRRFLLSAVAPSTTTRYPRKARPINWAQRGGLASGGECLLTPRPHFTAHHARLVTRWFVLRTALLFVRSAVRLVYAELSGPVAVGSPKQAHRELGDRVPLRWPLTLLGRGMGAPDSRARTASPTSRSTACHGAGAGSGRTRHQHGVTADTEKTLAVDLYAVVQLQRDADAHHLGGRLA